MGVYKVHVGVYYNHVTVKDIMNFINTSNHPILTKRSTCVSVYWLEWLHHILLGMRNNAKGHEENNVRHKLAYNVGDLVVCFG